MENWKQDHHDYERPKDRPNMTDAEKQGACAVCGHGSVHMLHAYRAPLAESWARRQNDTIKTTFGNATSVVAWLEERTHEADNMAVTSTTQKDRRYARGRADAYRQAAIAILEIDGGSVDVSDIPIYGQEEQANAGS